MTPGSALARLGWIAELLSAPIIAGFLAGIAVIIIVHQLPDLLGVHSAGGSTLHRISAVVSHLGHVSVATLVIGLGVFALVLAAERIDGRLPGALVGLVGATVVVAAALAQALDTLQQDGVGFAVARAGDHLRDNLSRSGLVERIGAAHFYPSVDEAVTAASGASAAPHAGRG